MVKKICGVPFSEVGIYSHPHDVNKLVFISCCPTWLEAPYNDFSFDIPLSDSGEIMMEKIWNSERLINLRKSIASGEYTFCKKDRCPNYISNTLPPLPEKAIEYINKGIYNLSYPPIHAHLAIDPSCNLHCPSCRSYPNINSNPETEKWLKSILDFGIEYIGFNYNGEAFNNPYFLKFMRNFNQSEYPNLKKVDLITNGIQLDQRMWESLSGDFKKIINFINVSVDAATEDTYNKIRLGGNFNKVYQNINFLGQLRKKGIIEHLTISMVLQKANKDEIIEFAKMVIDIGANCVCICRVENWLNFAYEEFYDRWELPENFFKENYYKIREIKKMFNDAGIVFMNNIECY